VYKLKQIPLQEAIPISGIPALFIPKLNATVIADIHIGYEKELMEKGIFLLKNQEEELLSRVENMFSIVKSKRLIINGDLKHTFKKPSKKEVKSIENFLLKVTAYYKEVIFIRGNHDTYVKGILKNYNIEMLEYFSEKSILILHGHKENERLLKEHDMILIGHEHPSILIRNEFGQTDKLIAIIYVPTLLENVLIILPPFSLLASGTPINSYSIKEKFLSPITKKYAIIEEGIPYVIDKNLGTIEFPKIKDLK
jgi:putative SbcD/Mre11-related phosphoesterase